MERLLCALHGPESGLGCRMGTTLELASVEEKARELCGFVLEQESYRGAWKDIEAFLEDESAKRTYRDWQEKGAEMHHLQHQGIEPSEGELAELERLEGAVMANPLAANFVSAEGQMNRIFGTVTKLLQKTLQMGRVPSPEEMAEHGCCGNHSNHGGCGCH